MQKIPTLFRRDPADLKHVLPEVTPGCEWVLNGEGVATRKYDGTCVLVRNGAMFARREVKPGKQPPPDFELIETDPATGKSVGWVPVTDAPEYARHWEAYERECMAPFDRPADGTYELCGPKVNGNPEALPGHALIPHGCTEMDAPRAFEALRDYLLDQPHEGIVWHHPDGRMAKLKRRDF